MYSLVLMTALAASPNSADFNGYFRDRWFGNCSGSCTGCTGSTSAASFSGSCNGCSCHGGLFSGDRIRSLFGTNCNGCCGGTQVYAGCCGGSTFYAGCSGGYDMPSPYAQPMGVTYYGCGSSMPSGIPMLTNPAPTLIPPTNLPGASPYAQPAPAEVREYTPKNQLPLPGGAAPSPNRGTVIVKLPADAKLFAEGKELALTSGERAFVTPELPQGREYNYTFRVEYDRGGRTLSESRTVSVTPGKVSTVEFNELAKGDPIPKAMPEAKPATTTSVVKSEPAPAGERARLSVKVPMGATLYVNDAKQGTNEFRTPPLPAGKEFTYTMKIETLRNGMPESVTQQVKFRAGDSIMVDFTGTDMQAAIR